MAANLPDSPPPPANARENPAEAKPPQNPWPMRWVISAVAIFVVIFNVYYFVFA